MNMERKLTRHKYIQNPTYLFKDDCKDEEGTLDIAQSTNSFRPRFPPLQKKTTSNGEHIEELEQQRQDMMYKKHEIEQRTLDSASRGLGLLHNSEKIGMTTAEELVCQGEKLNNTNKRLDEINPNLNKSQKHLKNINSIFNSIKKYISGKSDPEHSRRANTRSLRRSHPKSRLMDITLSRRSLTDCNYSSHPSTLLHDFSEQQVESKQAKKSFEDKLTENLNEMGQVVARLKELGTALGEEIVDQNKLIDTISDKMEDADIKINNQNKMMNKFLGK